MSYYPHKEPDFFKNFTGKSMCPKCHNEMKWFPYRKDWECQNPKCPIEIIRVKSLF